MKITNHANEEGKPTGGEFISTGVKIKWQKGPLGRGSERKGPNGAFVETVIEAAKQRLEFFQESEFECQENAEAIAHLKMALYSLKKRTERRESEGVEGTHHP